MDLTTIAVVFGSIFIVELPDKTFIAALVLSTRYQPLAVWIGVGVAFGVQTLVAVTVGFLATLLPTQLVQGVAIAIFLIGAIVLFRTAPGADAAEKEQEEEFAAMSTETRTFFKAAVASFLHSIDEEVAGTAILVAVVYPMGSVDTPANRRDMPDADPASWIDPVQIAEALHFAATRSPRGRILDLAIHPPRSTR